MNIDKNIIFNGDVSSLPRRIEIKAMKYYFIKSFHWSLPSGNDLYSTWSRRDYTYIDDIIDGVMAAIDYSETKYEIINLGNNRTIELLELVESIEEASGIEADRTHVPEVPGVVEQTWADVTKAKVLLGFDSNYDLEQGLSNFVKWYRKSQLSGTDVVR